jgi:hypothetical protein
MKRCLTILMILVPAFGQGPGPVIFTPVYCQPPKVNCPPPDAIFKDDTVCDVIPPGPQHGECPVYGPADIHIDEGTLVPQVEATAGKHSTKLNWTAPTDANATSIYNVYRAKTVCPVTGPGGVKWSKLASTGALTYTDFSVTPGPWCYYVTQVQSGLESAPSNLAGATVPPNK